MIDEAEAAMAVADAEIVAEKKKKRNIILGVIIFYVVICIISLATSK